MSNNHNPALPKGFGLTVEVQHGNVEQALRKLKRKVNNDGILMRAREIESYEKPTSKRVRKAKAAKARDRKRVSQDTKPKRLY